MNGNGPLDLGYLLANVRSFNGSDIHQMIVDLDILADNETALFMKEFSQNDLSPFLSMLPTLPQKTKTCALRFIEKVFRLLRPAVMVSKYAEILVEMLNGEYDEEIKTFYLKQLLESCLTSEGVIFLVEDAKASQILKLVAKHLQDSSLSVAKHASDVIQAILKSASGANQLLSDDFMSIFFTLLKDGGAVIRFRVYQLFIDSLAVNESMMDNKKIVDIIHMLIKELDNNDILSQLNCLEMLSVLASSSGKALGLITEYGTLERLRGLFKDQEIGPLENLLLPGTVKFFGSIATKLPSKVLPKYPDFQSFLFENANSDDVILKTLCFETIASISSSDEGLFILYQNHKEFGMVMKMFSKEIMSPVDEVLKKRMIDALKIILTKSDGPLSNESSSIKQELYNQLSEQPINLLMKCSQIPFSKIRYSALDAIKAIACHSWSGQDIAQAPGFLEYLLDRQTESEKEGKELKYGIIKILSQSPSPIEVFGKGYYEQICKFVTDGPFHSEQQTAIDYEMSS